MRNNTKQASLLVNDARKSVVKPVKVKPLKSVVKFPLTDEQLTWAIGHNLTWVMGMVTQ